MVAAEEDIPIEKVILNYMAKRGLLYQLPKAVQAAISHILSHNMPAHQKCFLEGQYPIRTS